MTPAKVIGQRWVVYHYDTIKYHRPQDGELVVFIDPDIQAGNKQFLSFVVGYGNRTVEELRGNTSVTIGLVQQNLEALADSFSAHTAKTDAHSATSVPAANRIAMYDAAKRLHTGADAELDWNTIPYRQGKQMIDNLRAHIQQQLDAMPVSYVTLDAGIPYVTVTGCYYISQE